VKVTAIKCGVCSDTIYSRTQHDFRWCSCENVAIDGGLDYTKICGSDYTMVEVDIGPLTVIDLHKDWNKRIDKLGLIKEKRKKK